MPSKAPNPLQIVGYVFALGEAFAPALCTFPRFIVQQTVNPNTCFPYEIIWLNGVVQLAYALRTHNGWEVGVYGAVVAVTSLYCLIYICLSTDIYLCLALWMLLFKGLVIGALLAIELTVFRHGHSRQREKMHGILVVFITMMSSFSPAKEVLTAYKTHQVGGLDILLSVAFLGNAIIATVSAFQPFNIFELICGVAGIVCSAGQCYVWVRCQCHIHNHNGQGAQGWHPIAQLFGLIGWV